MATDLSQGATHQSTGTAESTANEHAGGGTTDDMGGDGGVQPSGEEGNTQDLGNDNLPPELKEARTKLLQDYHKKTQELAGQKKQFEVEVGQHKQNTQILGQLMDQPWFKKAYEAEKARRSGAALPDDLTDEQIDRFRENPKEMLDWVRKYADTVLENKLSPKLSQTESKVAALESERAVEQLSGKHKDFRKAYDGGNLDKYLKQGVGLEAAFGLWKVNEGSRSTGEDVLGEAERLLAARKQGAVEKPGSTQPKGAEKVYKAKNLTEAFDAAYEARKRGETNFRIVKG